MASRPHSAERLCPGLRRCFCFLCYLAGIRLVSCSYHVLERLASHIRLSPCCQISLWGTKGKRQVGSSGSGDRALLDYRVSSPTCGLPSWRAFEAHLAWPHPFPLRVCRHRETFRGIHLKLGCSYPMQHQGLGQAMGRLGLLSGGSEKRGDPPGRQRPGFVLSPWSKQPPRFPLALESCVNKKRNHIPQCPWPYWSTI